MRNKQQGKNAAEKRVQQKKVRQYERVQSKRVEYGKKHKKLP